MQKRELYDIDLIPDCDPSKVLYSAFYEQPRRDMVPEQELKRYWREQKRRRNQHEGKACQKKS